MRKNARGSICLLTTVLFVLQTICVPLCFAQGEGAPDSGEAISVGGDSGEPVADMGSGGRRSSGIWKAMLGLGAVLVAGFGGYLLGDESEENKEDAEKAAQEAADSAAEAEAAAAGEDADRTKLYITGCFEVSQAVSFNGNPPFTPAIKFAVETATYPGGVIGYESSDGTGWVDKGGTYTQGEGSTMFVSVPDGFYIGRIEKVSALSFWLCNDVGKYTFYATGDAKIYEYKTPEE